MTQHLLSIRTQVSVVVLLPIIVVSALLLAISSYTSGQIESRLSGSLVSSTNRMVQAKVLDALNTAQWVSDLYRLRVLHNLLATTPSQRWEQMMFQSVSTQPTISSVTYATPDGDAVAAMRIGQHIVLGRAQGGSVNLAQEFLFDANGDVSAQPSGTYPFNARARPWFRQAMEGDGPSWTPVYAWPDTDFQNTPISSVAYTRRLEDRQGQLLGVLAVEISFEAVAQVLRESDAAQAGAVALVDQHQHVLASTGLSVDKKRMPRVEQLSGVRSAVLRDALNGLGPDRSAETKRHGYYLSVQPVEPVPGISWRLATLIPENVINAETASLQRSMAIAGVCCSLLALAFGVGMSRRIVRPIQNMASAVRNVGAARRQDAGTLDIHIERQGSVELDQLGAALTDMTRQLKAQVALRAQKEAIERAADAKNAFFARVTHELRTPLNSVIGYAEMLDEQATVRNDATTRQDVRRILQASRQLLSLINDLLQLAKAESERMPIEWADVPLSELLSEVEAIARPLMSPNRNTFVTELSCDASLRSDRDKLRRILINLVANAAKFTHEGRVILRASSDNVIVRFTVIDNGVGIDRSKLALIFEPFTQVDAGHEGTGLGLAITRQLTHLLGGEIEIESEPGHGTRVDVYFPIARRAEIGEPAQTIKGGTS